MAPGENWMEDQLDEVEKDYEDLPSWEQDSFEE